MSDKAVRPEDILQDSVDAIEKDGKQYRKGSVAAVIANAELLASDNVTDEAKQDAINVIKELAPTVIAIGLHNHVSWNNKILQDIFDEAALQL